MRIAYVDCFSGISGDMTLAALVDAGADRDKLEQELRKLSLGAFQLKWTNVVKKGVSALKLDVIDEEANGHSHEHDHHHHGHESHHHHSHAHRRYKEIVEMIENAGLSARVKKRSLAIFQEIGIAEAKIHNVSIDTVHFHEVGALDSIIDIVGVALALEDLGIDELYCGSIPVGNGFIRCDHGLYPVPAPATMEMLKDIPIRSTNIQKELTTPTGAGIASALVKFFGPLPSMTVEVIGYGAGTRDLDDQPNVLRILVGELSRE